MKVAVITDSGSNYYSENIRPEGLFCVSLQVIDADKGYREGQEITPKEVYELLAQGKMLKTSSPLVADVEAVVDDIIEQGYEMVFSVNITTGLSSTIQMVKMVCEQKGIKHDYFDCWTTARAQLECATKALKLFNEGKEIEVVKEELQTMADHSRTFVLPVDMKHLVKGGRITPLAGALAGFLKINPVLYLDEGTKGVNEVYKKVRTQRKAFEIVVSDMLEEGVDESYKICVTHVRDLEAGERMAAMIKEAIPNADYYLTDLVPVVGCHTGVGCVAVQYVKK